MEILGYKGEDKEMAKLSNFMQSAVLLEITNEVINKTIEIRKTVRIKLPDAIIAATALVNNLNLLTHNLKDFEKIGGLDVISPNML